MIQIMKIGVITLNPTIGNIKENLHKITCHIKDAIKENYDILIFPELSISGYPPKDLLLFPEFIKSEQKALQSLKKFSNSVAILIGAVSRSQRNSSKLYNGAHFIYKGKIQTYHKRFLPCYDVFDEPRYFNVGQNAPLFKWKAKKIGITICEDIWGEESNLKARYEGIPAPLKKLQKSKPDLIINLSASPFESGKDKIRQRLVTNISKKLNVPFIYVNQSGANDELIFDGAVIATSKSKCIYHSADFKEARHSFIFKNNKTLECLSQPQKLTSWRDNLSQALITGIHDYVIKSGFQKVVLGISGGIDSAVVASLAVKALGSQNVTGLIIPSQYTSSESVRDANTLCKHLGIAKHVISLNDLHQMMRRQFSDDFNSVLSDLTEQNIQARLRGNIIMAYANNSNALMLNTSNKSELAMGYGTLYGDLGGALAVLGDVTKDFVYELARHINHNKIIIPENIIHRAPSAELKPNQKDEDSLPIYECLDPQVKKTLTKKILPKNKIDKFSAEQFKKALFINEYKRRQAPPILKVSTQAFGFGWRLPIVNRYL